VEFVADFADIRGGDRGYHQDHEFFEYRQSILPVGVIECVGDLR
jgi:hypothetical protein